jgi:hypothetical protein
MQDATLVEYSREACPDESGGDPCTDATWITLIEAESGEQRVLEATRSPGQGDGSLGNWSWSPDGQAILLERPSQGGWVAVVGVVDIETDTATGPTWEFDAPFLSWQRVAAD